MALVDFRDRQGADNITTTLGEVPRCRTRFMSRPIASYPTAHHTSSVAFAGCG